MKIYIVKASEGRYDDYHQWNVKGFSTQEAAQAYIDTQASVCPQEAYDELDSLEDKYTEALRETDVSEYTDSDWAVYYEDYDRFCKQAFDEVQVKYPECDLSIGQDFHGYTIEELEMEE